MRRALAFAALVVAAALAGCADDTAIRAGGRVPGGTLTVYSLLPAGGPHAAATRDLVLGEKLALAEAGGQAGRYPVNFVAATLPDPARDGAVAARVRNVVRDQGVAAVIGDLSADTARTTVPLFNAVGILHVSPGVTYPGFLRPVGDAEPDAPGRYQPAGRPSFAPFTPADDAVAAHLARAAKGRVAVEATAGAPEQALAAQLRTRVGETVPTARADTVVVLAGEPEDAAGIVHGVLAENRRARVLLGPALWSTDLPDRLAKSRRVAFVTTVGAPAPAFARAFEATFGRPPGPWAQVGYDAMRSVLDAIDRAGPRAQNRPALIDAYFAGDPAVRAAQRPWWLARRTADGKTRYEPVKAG